MSEKACVETRFKASFDAGDLARAVKALATAGVEASRESIAQITLENRSGTTHLRAAGPAGIVSVEIDGQVEGTTINVERKRLADLAKIYDTGRVEFRQKANTVTMKVAGSTFRLRTSPTPVPNAQLDKDAEPFPVLASDLTKSLKTVKHARAAEHGRPDLAGVALVVSPGRLEYAATDSTRICVVTQPNTSVTGNLRRLLTSHAADALNQLASGRENAVMLALTEQRLWALFEAEPGYPTVWVGYQFSSHEVVAYQTPVKQAKQGAEKARMSRSEILQATEAAQVVSDPLDDCVLVLTFAREQLVCRLADDIGEIRISLEEGSAINEVSSMSLNPKFLKDALKALDVESIEITLTADQKAVLIRSDECPGVDLLIAAKAIS